MPRDDRKYTTRGSVANNEHVRGMTRTATVSTASAREAMGLRGGHQEVHRLGRRGHRRVDGEDLPFGAEPSRAPRVVATGDQTELETIKKNFLIKKLGLSDADGLDDAIAAVGEKMKGVSRKNTA